MFKKIGRAFGKLFKAIGRAIKKVLASPIFRAVITLLACGTGNPLCGAIVGGALSAGATLAAGGSLGDALKAAAFVAASVGAFQVVGQYVTPSLAAAFGEGTAAFAIAKGTVHGVVGGAFSAAQGGNFHEGFAGAGFAASAGVFTDGISGGDVALDTAIVSAVGCAGAVLGGGKCANGAATAAFANLYNKYGGSRMPLEGDSGSWRTDPRPSGGQSEEQFQGSLFGFVSGAIDLLTSGNPLGFASKGALKQLFRNCFSLAASTEVRTKRGFIPIANVRPRMDFVWARDEETGANGWKLVENRGWNSYEDAVLLRVRDTGTGEKHTIVANRTHPIYVSETSFGDLKLVANGGLAVAPGTNASGRWVEAQHMMPGDRLWTDVGSAAEVISRTVERTPLKAYNLHVRDFHTFFVRGANNDNAPAVWVHNCKEESSDFNNARNAALKWLDQRGFKAEQVNFGKFGSTRGLPVGMKSADGRSGFRIEYDARSGAHINVFSGKEKGVHFTFSATEKTVRKLQRSFRK